jgi:hypothetical protein
MAKKAKKSMTPIEAGFVQFFSNMEIAFKKVNDRYGALDIEEPQPVQKNPRTPDRDFINPFQGGI